MNSVHGPPGDPWVRTIQLLDEVGPDDAACGRCGNTQRAWGWYSLDARTFHCAGCQIIYWRKKADRFRAAADRIRHVGRIELPPPTAADIARLRAAHARWN